MKFTKIDDYVDKVAEKFPTIPKKSIRRILEFGSRSFYAHAYYGADALLKAPYFTLYCGRLFADNLIFHKYWCIKMRIKLRFQYAKRKTPYSGYYYFGLTDEEYAEYKKQFKSKTKRRQKFTFKNLFLYKILNECLIYRHRTHFFKVEMPEDKFSLFKEEFTIRQFEYLGKRNGDQSIEYVSDETRSK